MTWSAGIIFNTCFRMMKAQPCRLELLVLSTRLQLLRCAVAPRSAATRRPPQKWMDKAATATVRAADIHKRLHLRATKDPQFAARLGEYWSTSRAAADRPAADEPALSQQPVASATIAPAVIVPLPVNFTTRSTAAPLPPLLMPPKRAHGSGSGAAAGATGHGAGGWAQSFGHQQLAMSTLLKPPDQLLTPIMASPSVRTIIPLRACSAPAESVHVAVRCPQTEDSWQDSPVQSPAEVNLIPTVKLHPCPVSRRERRRTQPLPEELVPGHRLDEGDGSGVLHG